MGSWILFHQINKPRFSIRWKLVLVYLGLISIAFGLVVLGRDEHHLGTYTDDQPASARQRQAADDLALEKEVTPDVKSADADQMYSLLVQRGRENGARILILDSAGTVWVDTLSELNGVRLGLTAK